MRSLAQQFLEKFDLDTQKDVEKWARSIPSYDDISKVGKKYWDKAKEIAQKKYKPGDDYWTIFFDVLDDLTTAVPEVH